MGKSYNQNLFFFFFSIEGNMLLSNILTYKTLRTKMVGFHIPTHYVFFPITPMNPLLITLVTLLTKALMLKGELQENRNGIQNSVKATPFPISTS